MTIDQALISNNQIHSLPKVKQGEENTIFQKPISIEEDAILCRGR